MINSKTVFSHVKSASPIKGIQSLTGANISLVHTDNTVVLVSGNVASNGKYQQRQVFKPLDKGVVGDVVMNLDEQLIAISYITHMRGAGLIALYKWSPMVGEYVHLSNIYSDDAKRICSSIGTNMTFLQSTTESHDVLLATGLGNYAVAVEIRDNSYVVDKVEFELPHRNSEYVCGNITNLLMMRCKPDAELFILDATKLAPNMCCETYSSAHPISPDTSQYGRTLKGWYGVSGALVTLWNDELKESIDLWKIINDYYLDLILSTPYTVGNSVKRPVVTHNIKVHPDGNIAYVFFTDPLTDEYVLGVVDLIAKKYYSLNGILPYTDIRGISMHGDQLIVITKDTVHIQAPV